jgi:precorrin-3B C17-methyltransferase
MALETLRRAGAVVGYDRYMTLVDAELLAGKAVFSSPMKKELERTARAVEFAMSGLDTVVVSSGDSGVYGMAGLVLEYLEREGLLDAVDLDVVPGIPALCAAAALLGAPLMHDFAAISLSDLLTPLPLIMKRVECAVEGDFVMVLYNPRSRKRASYLGRTLDMAAARRGPDTPVGFVRNAYRPDQEVRVATLGSCDPEWADMLSTVVIGNSASRLVGGKILTPRGYYEKYA